MAKAIAIETTVRLIYGNFESKKEALEKLTEVKKKGYNTSSLIIKGLCYKIFFGEFNKATGEKVLATLKVEGFEAELI